MPSILTPLSRAFTTLMLASLLLSAGCARQPPDSSQLRADENRLVRQTIAEPERLERFLELLEQRESLDGETRAMRKKFRREMYLLNADYDARREVVLEIVDVFNRERADALLRIIEQITAMKAAATAAEWRLIADFQLEFFDSRQTEMLVLFTLGGGLMGGAILTPPAADRLGSSIAGAIAEPERAAQAAQVVADLRGEIDAYLVEFRSSEQGLRAIYRDHDAGSRRLLEALERLNLAWYTSQSRNMVQRDRLRKILTSEEWTKVFPVSKNLPVD